MELSAEANRLQQKMAQASALALKRMHLAQTRFDYYVEMVCRDNLGNPIRLSEIHRAWIRHVEYCWQRGLRALILAPFGHGKCQPGRSMVQLADGSMVPIGTLDGLIAPVLAFDEETWTYRPAFGRAFKNGRKRVWRVRLDSGREVDVTAEHPFLTIGGWKKAGQLRCGDFVASANSLPSVGHRALPDGEAELLGYMVGDGSCSGTGVFTNCEQELLDDFAGAAERVGFVATEQKYTGFRKRARSMRLSKGTNLNRSPMYDSPAAWMRRHGLFRKNSYSKRTPQAIFTAPPEQVGLYLGAYFACDGTVDKNERGAVEYYSVSRDLLREVQSLLARLGVASRLREKNGRYKGARHKSWRLAIARASLENFSAKVIVAGEKGRHLREVAERTKGGAKHGNGDLVPLAYRSMLLRSAYWHKINTGVSLDQVGAAGRTQGGTSRPVVRAAAVAEGNSALIRETSDSVWWDEVKAIVDLGEEETYGLDVDDLHTYISDGVIVHNTSTLVVPLCSWLMGRDITTRIKIVTNEDNAASERLMACKRTVESNSFRQVFPTVRRGDRWNNHELFLKRAGYSTIDPTLHARGIWTTGVGSRADYMFFDDVVDQKNSTDPAQRKKVLQFVEGTWLNRLEPTGHVLGIGTAWHQGDANHVLIHRPGWCTLIHRVSADCTSIEQEVLGARDGQYPIPPAISA